MDSKPTDGSREDSKLPTSCALWPVDLKLTHTDCNPNYALVHFQGQYATTCELDYNILQVEIQNVPKTTVSVDVGDECLVEDLLSSQWYRGRVQNKSGNLFDVFLLDHGNILTVGPTNLSSIPDTLLMLPPKIVSGFIANVLPFQERWVQPSRTYFSSLIGRHIEGYIHGLLPYKVLILEVPEMTKDLLRLSLGRHVDTDTFLFLVELELDEPIQQSCESVPDLLIEKQTALEISFKSSDLCGYKNILSLGGSKLAVGQTERVRVAAAVNPGLFYCQLSSAAKDLKEMSEKLALMCELKNGEHRDKSGENMGLLCAVKGKDEKWHRGLVQCLPVNSQVRVVFVDYGYCESVKVENIFQLPSDFLLRPVMAFPCSLSCLGDKDKVNQQRQLGLLRKGLLGTELVITIDDLSKEKYICSVTLSNVDECAPFKTVQCEEVDKLSGCGTFNNVHRLSYITNETNKLEISKMAFEDIHDGSVFEGYVEHVQSPHDFWMRSAKFNDQFTAMMNKLDDWFNRLQLNEEILQDPVPGQLCCAMYEKDMHYYRAVVVDILQYGAEVFFIDFGNTEKVPSMLIKKIPTEFTVEPVFAFNCSLAHVVPLEDEWTAAATDFFRDAISATAALVHVIYRRSNVFVVEMYEKGFGKSESIATLLTNANMAISWTYSVVKPRDTPVGKNNKIDNTFARRQFADKSLSQKLATKVTRQEINKCVDKQVETETKKMTGIEFFKVHKFKPGTVMSVQCSHISSPSDFWCQNKKTKSDLDGLMERLQRFYQTNASVLQPQSLCCAVHLQLVNKWYRGCIFEEADLTVKVILIDYGIVVQEKLEKLQALNPEFLKLEGQAFRCSLYNLTNPVEGNVWSDKANALLKDFTSGNSDLKCKIYSQVYVANKGFCNMVDLYTPFQQASTHLIERGVAKEIQHPKQLFSSVYPCSFVYSSLGITIGSEELVFPTCVVSPWEIYLQLDRNTEIIEQLMDRAMKKSEELMSQTQTTREFADAWPSVCLAKYSEDGKWYRSFVWPAKSSLHVNVFFVDYGGNEVAEKKNVLSIPIKAADLLSTPMQALRCSLLNILEEEHLPEVNTWLEKAILNKGLRAKFSATNSSGHFICDLFDGDLHINEKVREIFAIHKQNGKSVSKPIGSCSKEVSSVANKFTTNWKPHVESVVESQRTSVHSKVIMGNGQSSQKNSSKVKSSQKSDNPNGISAKNGRGKDNHSLKPTKQPQKETGTIPKVQPARLPNVSDLPAIKIAPGYRCIGFISHCDSVKSFFIQMETDEQNILKMREELNSSSFTKCLQSVTSNIKVGHLVAARYDQDLALYRAAVKGVASSSFLTVEFVDYGNTAIVDKKKIHPLASKFLSQARLSTHCTLSKPYNQDDVESLISDANDKPLMVEFVQNLGYAWEVSIQRLDSWHESRKSESAEGMEKNFPNSDQAEPSQKLYAAVDEDDASHTSICKITEAETSNVKKDTKRLKHGIKVSKVVQEKTLEKEQAKEAIGRIQKLKTSKKACTYECKNDKKQDICQSDLPQKLEIDINVTKNELLNISVHPAPPAISPEEPMDKDNEIQRLFFAPVKQDHEYSGFAAAVTTPGNFFVVPEDLLLIMIALLNVLEDLPEDFAPLPEAHLIPGSGCLVKSEERKKWCRAEIIQCDPKTVMVYLVDYGYFVHLACQDVCRLKVLPVELAAFPKITYPCLLRGIKPADGLQWSDQAALFFQQCIYQTNLKIHFRQCVSEAQWVVDVITSNRNVAKELVDAGHAQYIDTVLGVRFHQGLGHKKETNFNSVENVYKAVTGTLKQTQSKMVKVPQRIVADVTSHNDEISGDGDTKEATDAKSDEHGSAEKTLRPAL